MQPHKASFLTNQNTRFLYSPLHTCQLSRFSRESPSFSSNLPVLQWKDLYTKCKDFYTKCKDFEKFPDFGTLGVDRYASGNYTINILHKLNRVTKTAHDILLNTLIHTKESHSY